MISRPDALLFLKAVIYGLLLINFGLYALEDWQSASLLSPDGYSFRAWARDYATTIDEAAWFTLLLLFEIETGVYAATLRRSFRWGIRALRILCWLIVAHTMLGYVEQLRSLAGIEPGAMGPVALAEAWRLAWLDVIELSTWLAILVLLEIEIRNGRHLLVLVLRALYALLLAVALYWAATGYYLYAWDEVLWVCGFALIGWNLKIIPCLFRPAGPSGAS